MNCKIRELGANSTNNLFAEIQRRKAAGNPMSLEEIQQLQRSQVQADAQAVLEALKKSLKRKP
jgi:hypothetical protein